MIYLMKTLKLPITNFYSVSLTDSIDFQGFCLGLISLNPVNIHLVKSLCQKKFL